MINKISLDSKESFETMIIGKQIFEAKELAQTFGFTIRIVNSNGKNLSGDKVSVKSRCNVHVVEDVVTKVSSWC